MKAKKTEWRRSGVWLTKKQAAAYDHADAMIWAAFKEGYKACRRAALRGMEEMPDTCPKLEIKDKKSWPPWQEK